MLLKMHLSSAASAVSEEQTYEMTKQNDGPEDQKNEELDEVIFIIYDYLRIVTYLLYFSE